MELKAVIEYLHMVPGPSLAAVDSSNYALSKYTKAQLGIKAMGNLRIGEAVLLASEGREEVGQLEKQLLMFVFACYQALVDGDVAASILALGRTIMRRLDLTVERDKEIVALLSDFANAELGFPKLLNKLFKDIKKMLKSFGLDRAADALDEGKFEDFLNMNDKTMTYAGAAIVGISALMECLDQQEDREQLNQAIVEIQREQKAKELLGERTAYTGYAAKQDDINQDDTRLANLEDNAVQASNKCGVPQDFMPTNLLKNTPFIGGVAVLGSPFISKNAQKLGRGIL
jgi:hypothetical protein